MNANATTASTDVVTYTATVSEPLSHLFLRAHEGTDALVNAEALEDFLGAVAAANGLAEGHFVREGQTLRIPAQFAPLFHRRKARPQTQTRQRRAAGWEQWSGHATGEKAASLFALAMADGRVTPDEMTGPALRNVQAHALAVLRERGAQVESVGFTLNAQGHIVGLAVSFPEHMHQQRYQGLCASALVHVFGLRLSQVSFSVEPRPDSLVH